MDLLEKYKESWKNQPEETNKVSKVDIYKIAHKKSSSIVKWIFIVGIIEFLGLGIFSLFYEPSKSLGRESDILESIIQILDYIYYPIIITFLYLFYSNYKRISITDSTKDLMKNILRTRKTVKIYVLINIAILVLVLFLAFGEIIMKEYSNNENKTTILLTILFMIIFSGIVILIVYLIYHLLYGILLRKLNRNYKELSKLDELN